LETKSRQDKTQRNWTKLSCLVSNCVHTTDTDKTRQDSFVSSMSAVWTSYYCRLSQAACVNGIETSQFCHMRFYRMETGRKWTKQIHI